jgi:hypothetical protein
MDLLVVLSILLCALVGTLVGLRLLSIAARSRKLPELAIGAGLFAYAALGQLGILAQQAIGEDASLGLRMGIVLLRVLGFCLTLLGLSLFTWQVFGAKSWWRRALAAGVAVATLVSAGLSIWASWLQLSASVPLNLYARIGMTPHFVLTFGWVSLESLRYHVLMRKRQALGLAEPVVTNRFLVWGAGEGVSSLVVLALFMAIITRGELAIGDPLVSVFVTLAGLVNALVWWLSFTPPTAYLRWVRGSAIAGASNG